MGKVTIFLPSSGFSELASLAHCLCAAGTHISPDPEAYTFINCFDNWKTYHDLHKQRKLDILQSLRSGHVLHLDRKICQDMSV